MKLPREVTVVEVGPRDGFQSEKQIIPTDEKVAIVNALSRTGLKKIEVTSAVHPKAIPQLADAEEVMTRMDRPPGVLYRILAPNLRGVQRAILLKPDEINLMMSVTESHNRSNANRSVAESLAEYETLVPMISAAGILATGGMGCAFGCPFEGQIPIARLEQIVDRYRSMGIRSVGLSDTVGVANPQLVYNVVSHMLEKYPDVHFHMHCHNNRGLALANILAGMQAGVTEFDAAVGGLGGCPYAPNASGNISTEDVVNMMNEMGIETAVDLDALLRVSERVKKVVPHPLDSAVVKAGKPWVLQKAPDRQIKVG